MIEHTSTASAASDDVVVATAVAERASELLLELRSSLAGADPKFLRDEGDRRSHELITHLLAELRPDDAILSEEGGAGR